jgi:hypothetical protein
MQYLLFGFDGGNIHEEPNLSCTQKGIDHIDQQRYFTSALSLFAASNNLDVFCHR